MNVTFSSNGRNYTATSNDIFMDNGARIVFILNGKHANPTAPRVELKPKEWERIKPQLRKVDYESYFGRKPAVNGVNIFAIKNNEGGEIWK